MAIAMFDKIAMSRVGMLPHPIEFLIDEVNGRKRLVFHRG